MSDQTLRLDVVLLYYYLVREDAVWDVAKLSFHVVTVSKFENTKTHLHNTHTHIHKLTTGSVRQAGH